MIIKKFIYENGTHTKVLVVVPPAIEDSWRRAVKDFELDNHFTFITIGSLNKILDKKNYSYPNPEDIDLIVVDESHKFRNDYTEMYLALQEICKMPRSRAAENGDSRKKVILISATPLNNRPQDIENQLYLFQDRRNSTLENVRNLQEYFTPKNNHYEVLARNLSKFDPKDTEYLLKRKKTLKKLKTLFQQLRNDIIEPLVIRRTRTDIENNPEYLEDLEKQGIKFPKVDDPIALKYELDEKLSNLFFDTVSLITKLDEVGNEIEGLGYYRYRAIEFLTKEEDRKMYGNVVSISDRLAAIMKTLLVKRLESSFYAFTQSLSRFQKAIDNMLAMFDDNRIFIAPDLDINKLLEEGLSYDEIEVKINEKGGNNREYAKDDFEDNFYSLLKEEQIKVDNLIERWKEVKNDPKLTEFAEQIKKEFFKPNQNSSGKLIIFSESKETVEELERKLSKITKKKVLTVSAQNRKYVEDTIRNNFDANLEEDEWQSEYDIIITTEVLAEGINLHRSNVIVNYDVPWNSTRLMQRIGRVNRIGSRADKIYVYNFYPSAHGDAQIHLVNNALRKLQAFHTAFGEDNKVFSVLEEKGEGALFGNKVQKEESEILKYLNELRDFRKKHPKIFNDISKIPNKARCGRKLPDNQQLTLLDAETGEKNYPLQNTSLTYLKSENHPGIFCLITPEMNIVEMNFLQAVKLFKASDSEKAIALHELHHQQTLAGLEYFKSEKNQENVQAVSRRNLSPAENKAITNINSLVKIAPTEQKRIALLRTLDTIKKGTFTSKGLPKSINVFFTSNAGLFKEPDKFIEQFFITVLDRYDFSLGSEEIPQSDTTSRGIINPQIVLTQSFS